MSKHTPGPWQVAKLDSRVVETASGPAQGLVVADIRSPLSEHGREDAALIAAAPDLLAALKAIKPYLVGGEAIIANAAIAKAEGEPGISFTLMYGAQEEVK